MNGFANLSAVRVTRSYSCSSVAGCNGTVWASNKSAYTYFRIDTASTPGYATAA